MLGEQQMKLHLVDATFELFRAFYSRPLERAPDGRPVNGVHGLLESMLSLLREPDVTHVGAATDHVIESWRNDVFPGYKSSARSLPSGWPCGRWSRTRPTTPSPPPSPVSARIPASSRWSSAASTRT